VPSSTKYLRPDVLARLRGLELRARSVVAGFLSGMHRSAYHGYSVEFAEHRQYVPGDDIRHIDWRLFGRADRFYIKQYEEETNLRCNILLDVSRSMDYGEGRENKFDYACSMAATLAWLLAKQRDAFGLVTFDHEVRDRLPSATGQVQLTNFTTLLESSRPDQTTDVKVLFHRLAEELRRRSMVVLISDLFTDVDDVIKGLEHIGLARHELIVMHVMHDDERRFPFIENIFFDGLEEDAQLLTDPQSLRGGYLAAVDGFVKRIRSACMDHGVDYVPVNTKEPLEAVLAGYLAGRSTRGPRGVKRA
jgi:uncharacterized protein (DUF58 family)